MSTWYTPDGIPVDENDRMPGDLPYNPRSVTPPMPASSGARTSYINDRFGTAGMRGYSQGARPGGKVTGSAPGMRKRPAPTQAEYMAAARRMQELGGPARSWEDLTKRITTTVGQNLTSTIPTQKPNEEERLKQYQQRIEAQRRTRAGWNWGL